MPTDVIVPIYGAAAELARCLASVVAHTDLGRHGLLLVVDGPQAPEVEEVIRRYPARVLRNDIRRGFVGSVNVGMAASTRDVVLLNSDAIVTAGWLEKMLAAASSAPDVGTVTPLSNNATLCSVPRGFEENLLPSGYDIDSFAKLIERVSARDYPALPTGVGVCLFIRRALLDEIGLFDEQRFPLGYGEENDFCMRAAARGWRHVADDATFVYHAGHRSFGASRVALQRKAARTLNRLHPGYRNEVARFMREDPLRAARARIAGAVRASGPPSGGGRKPSRIVHVVHGWPPFQHAGAELYAYWLVRRQVHWRDVAVYARMDDPARAQGEAVELMDEGARVRLVTNNFVQRHPLARNAMRDATFERDFARFLKDERPELVHIHHLAGHSFSLAGVARRMGIPIVQQLQDWWPLCGRVNLCDVAGRRCSGPGLSKCARCAPLTGIAPKAMWNRVLHLVRRRAARRSLAAADAYVMGSDFIRNDYQRSGMLPNETPLFVLPYGVSGAAAASAAGSLLRRPKRPPLHSERVLHFGFVGSILPHKGLHVAVEAFRGIDPQRAVLRAWGNAAASPEYTRRLRERAGPGFTLEGSFAESDKPAIFASLDVLIVPSIGLESFGLAAREAMAAGVPVIATRDGALTEMTAEFFPSGDAAALEAIVRKLLDAPELLDAWRARIPPTKSADEHAEEIEEVYRSVLERRRWA